MYSVCIVSRINQTVAGGGGEIGFRLYTQLHIVFRVVLTV